MRGQTYEEQSVKARLLRISGEYAIVVDSINGSDAYIYKGTLLECKAMAQYHNFQVTYIAP